MNVFERATLIDPAHFRQVMSQFATGVTVITAEANGEKRGMTANAFMSGSLEPPFCVVSVAKRAHMHQHLVIAGRFAVNILAVGQDAVATHFAGRPDPRLEIVFTAVDGIPTLADCAAMMTADVAATEDCGDHTIFIGHLKTMESFDRPPLLFHGGHYASLVPSREIDASLPEFW